MSDFPPPPAVISTDDHGAADSARRRFGRKYRFPRFIPFLKVLSSRKKDNPSITAAEPPITSSDIIRLDPSKLDTSEESVDEYRWAIVYENQRGMTVFSVPYYSHLSLLPSDPSSFTLPNISSKQSEQLPVTLENYPLPDGAWRWVSKCWMIDMRSDSGEVQHDGFEYNWIFRSHKWRAKVGFLSAGGWVRRRRWVRLMMRPTHQHPGNGFDDSAPATIIENNSTGPSLPTHHQPDDPSLDLLIDAPIIDDILSIDDIWLSDNVERNWEKCRVLMRRLGCDGRKLELWKLWLSELSHKDGKGETKQAGDTTYLRDNLTRLRIPPKEYLRPVLQAYGNSLLRTFVYPDSRIRMVRMLESAQMLGELERMDTEVDFWISRT